VADWFASSNRDGPTEALGVFTQSGSYRVDVRDFHRKGVLLNDGRLDGTNVGISAQNGNEVGLAVPFVINFSNKPIKSKAYSSGGVLHSLGVFQHSKAFVGILHSFLSWGMQLAGEVAWVRVK
jgi:hypothetical protein